MQQHWNILSPIKLGTATCKNRIVMGAHSYGFADSEGLPTEELEYYLEERAKGGIGLVIMGGTSVSRDGTIRTGNPTINVSSRVVPKYRVIAAKAHRYETLVFDQLMHAGGQLRNQTGSRIVAPSPVHHERTRGTPIELTKDEIFEIIEAFVLAARRAQEGDLDGVEIKGDQGFLIHQFLSPRYNSRSDNYGGGFRRRLSFLLELLDRVRKGVGRDFVVGVRICADSFSVGDIIHAEALQVCDIIAATGLVNYLHINGATNSTYRGYLVGHGDSSIEERNFSHLARDIKKLVDIPVIVASMVGTPEDAEYLVSNNYGDMVAMTRAHIADPEIVNKIYEARLNDIRPCIRCNQECVGGHHSGRPIGCIHNPAAGREKELGSGTLVKTTAPKRVLIVGGGVAGMEVARVAALRGFDVHLLEKLDRLGGQLLLAARLPYMQGLKDCAQYLERQIRKLKVNIYLEAEVSESNLATFTEGMDTTVIATGSKAEIPPNYHRIASENAFTPVDMLENEAALKRHILVVDVNWRQNPLAVAEWLQQRGHVVTIISSDYFIGEGINIASRASYYSRIQRNVFFLPLTDFDSHHDDTAVLRNVLDNEIKEIRPIDQVVFVCGFSPNVELHRLARGLARQVHFVGDCVAPIGVADAILHANRLARSL